MRFLIYMEDQVAGGAWNIGEHSNARIGTGKQVVALMPFVFGERNDGDREIGVRERSHDDIELCSAAVYEDEIGEWPFRMPQSAG